MSSAVSDQTAERASIMAAAYRCLDENGGASVSVSDILAVAGLSTRAFYRHFESKDGLLLAMFRQDTERVLVELRAAAQQAGPPPEALRAWMTGMLRLAEEPRRRQRVLRIASEQMRRTRGYAAERARFEAGQDAALADIIARGRTDGSFPWASPDSDAIWIRAALGQVFADQLTDTPRTSAAEAADAITDLALRALGAAR